MWSLSCKFTYQKPVHISFVPDTIHVPCPSHPPCQVTFDEGYKSLVLIMLL